jgi:hypothetical protein
VLQLGGPIVVRKDWTIKALSVQCLDLGVFEGSAPGELDSHACDSRRPSRLTGTQPGRLSRGQWTLGGSGMRNIESKFACDAHEAMIARNLSVVKPQ